MDWSPVIAHLRPGEEWRLDDCQDLETLTWLSETGTPTREEIEAHLEHMPPPEPPQEEAE